MSMVVMVFDGSWDGLLSAVFDAYNQKIEPEYLLRDTSALPMFYDSIHRVETDTEKSSRVWTGLKKRLTKLALNALVISFMSELLEMDLPTFRYVCSIFRSAPGKERDFADENVLAVFQTAKKVRGEAHRMLQFVRFQKASDGTYFAMMEPIYDVLPLSISHFRDRFADQKFIIYDRSRDYGYYFDGASATVIHMPDSLYHVRTGRLDDSVMDADERLFQRLWRTYFQAIAIKERINPRKQRQDMPVRYWKYLTETNG